MRIPCKLRFFRTTMILILLMFVTLMSGCGAVSKPPALTAERLNTVRMPMTLGTYSWEDTDSDSGHPTEQVRDDEVEIFQAKNGIRLDFDGEEPFQITANLMSMEDPGAAPVPVIVRGTTLTLPDLVGYYALQVWAVWGNEDYASYALSIQIE
ncbi:hypothetical protein [Saccharibacillus endophyticus]|uniref:Lipoprotein n=1 Tax=Saccharibacillus endophyticus TaxID=2060666 RepID=A0ABQ1ZNW4_9BACL|nr:hypothetical protein [Saccharibacillus endophyticus]GGH70387.1 hypothetical protein GCM10007362_06460 [Saccharibacillus endophyticus]